jgi:hypothetical protein
MLIRDIPEAMTGVSTVTNKLRGWLHVDRTFEGDVLYPAGLQPSLREEAFRGMGIDPDIDSACWTEYNRKQQLHLV